MQAHRPRILWLPAPICVMAGPAFATTLGSGPRSGRGTSDPERQPGTRLSGQRRRPAFAFLLAGPTAQGTSDEPVIPSIEAWEVPCSPVVLLSDRSRHQ